MNNKKFKKNAKALSPVIASIILIAVTVAVSVVVAAWMGGMTIGLTANAEQASITNVQFTSNTNVTVTVENLGASTVTITSASIDGNVTAINGVHGQTFAVIKGTSGSLTLAPSVGQFINTAQYTIKLQTAKGNSLTYTATYSGP